jgi:hypothetical protein
LGDVERGLGVTCYLIKAAPDLSLVTKTYFREIIKHRNHISVYRVDIKLHYLSPLLSEHADLIFAKIRVARYSA